jgi:rubredoxin
MTGWESRFAQLGAMEVCYMCPSCGSTDVCLTLPSNVGAYCRCTTCGHVWHDEKKPPPRGRSLGRRRMDKTSQ